MKFVKKSTVRKPLLPLPLRQAQPLPKPAAEEVVEPKEVRLADLGLKKGELIDMDAELYHKDILDSRGEKIYSSSSIKKVVNGALYEKMTSDYLEFGKMIHGFIESLMRGETPSIVTGNGEVRRIFESEGKLEPFAVECKARKNKLMDEAILECKDTNKVPLTQGEMSMYEAIKSIAGPKFFFDTALKTQHANSVAKAIRIMLPELKDSSIVKMEQEKSIFLEFSDIVERARGIEMPPHLMSIHNLAMENKLSLKIRFDLLLWNHKSEATLYDFKTTKEQTVTGCYYATRKYNYTFSIMLYTYVLTLLGYNVAKVKIVYLVKSEEPRPPVSLVSDLKDAGMINHICKELHYYMERASFFKVLRQIDPNNMNKIELPMNKYLLK